MTDAIRYTLVAIVMSLATMHIDRVNTSLFVYCVCSLMRTLLWYGAGLSWGRWYGERRNNK